jgi:phospholipid/cholesterol/gamma-HCH transport system ATP-binding protein
MKTAFDCADRIAFLHEGKMHFMGTVKELQASTDPVLTNFIHGRSGEWDRDLSVEEQKAKKTQP